MPKKPRYDPNLAHRDKHRWDRDYASFVREEEKLVGKCPCDIDDAVAQRLLEDGIPYRGRNRGGAYPERIYNVYRGVPFRAHEMAPGVYHGFPEHPSRLPPEIREKLRARADEADEREAFEAWLASPPEEA